MTSLDTNVVVGHTPGPWYATTRQGSWDWLVAQSETVEICQMFHDGTEMNEVGEANARLVATAPEMLEALKGFNLDPDAIVGAQGQDIIVRLPMAVITRAAAVVAKAEGRS